MGRSPFSTHPSMGLPPTWKVGDMAPSYSTPVPVITAVTAPTTSAAFNPQANSIVLNFLFSDGATSCTAEVLNDDGTGTFNPVASFNDVNLFNESQCTVGEWPTGISLGGRAIKVAISNIVGTGTITVAVQRLN